MVTLLLSVSIIPIGIGQLSAVFGLGVLQGAILYMQCLQFSISLRSDVSDLLS